MAIIFSELFPDAPGSRPFHFRWPVELAVDHNSTLAQQIINRWFTREYTKILDLDEESPGHGGSEGKIFYVNYFADISLDDQFENLPVNFSGSIILIHKSAAFFHQAPDLENALVSSFMSTTGAAGVFLFAIPEGKSEAEWYEDFIIQLSHNKNIVDALVATVSKGIFRYSESVSRATVSTVLSEIITHLRHSRKYLGIDFTTLTFYNWQRFLNNSIDTGEKLSNVLAQFQNTVAYDQESGGARLVAALSHTLHTVPDDLQPGDPPTFTEPDGDSAPPRQPQPQPQPRPEAKRHHDKDKLFFPEDAEASVTPAAGSTLDFGIAADALEGSFHHLFEPVRHIRNTPTAPNPPPPQEDRYLQANIMAANGGKKKMTRCLADHQEYDLSMLIGRRNATNLVADTSIATELIFENSLLDKETLQVFFMSNFDKMAQMAAMSLPRQGDSNEVKFTFTTADAGTALFGEVYACHKGRVIQRVVIEAEVRAKGEAIKGDKIIIRTVFSARKDFRNFDERSVFGAAYHYEPDKSGLPALKEMKKDGIHIPAGSGLMNIVKDIKEKIETAARNPGIYPENLEDDNVGELLMGLAYKGSELYTAIGEKDPGNAVQIIANDPEFLPIEFVYKYPLPDINTRPAFCEHAVSALLEGACKNCFDHTTDPAPHLCPFGFWNFSKVIERYQYHYDPTQNRDFTVVSEPAHGKGTLCILPNTIHGSSARVDARVPGTRDKVAKAIQNYSSAAHVAQNWDELRKFATGESFNSIMLIVHIDKNKIGADQMEIGNTVFPKVRLNKALIKHDDAAQPPLAVVIGCEAANTEEQGFDVSAHFLASGAGIVLSNFTKIDGAQAGAIIIQLTEFLKQNSDKEMSLGEIVLKLKQYLLAKGIVAAMALVAFGDADWKIKS